MKALMIIAQNGYQPKEYGVPKEILENAGIEVITASKKVGICQGMDKTTTEATISIDDINVSDYDAIIFVGGSGAVQFHKDVEAHLTCQEAINRGKVLAAICIAPLTLAYADVLEGKKVTVWNEDNMQSAILERQGAIYTGNEVEVDGKIITANGPQAAETFGKKILELLEK